MRKINKFTDGEISIIVECIRANPNNLSEAFKIAARRTSRKVSAIWSKANMIFV